VINSMASGAFSRRYAAAFVRVRMVEEKDHEQARDRRALTKADRHSTAKKEPLARSA